MMKMKNLENVREGRTYAQVLVNFKTYYFSMGTKRYKAFGQGEPMPVKKCNTAL